MWPPNNAIYQRPIDGSPDSPRAARVSVYRGASAPIREINSIPKVQKTEAKDAFDAKGSVALRARSAGRHRAVLPHASNRIGTIALHIKGKAGVRNPQTGNEHHARQNDDRIGRASDCLGRNNDECIRSTKTHSTKKGQGNNTKRGVRDTIRGHSELGAANRASVRTSWSPWPSHPQTAPDSKQMTRWGPKPVAGLCPAERIAAMCPTNSRRRLPTGKFV